MHNDNTRLFVGPMSKEIVDNVIEYTDTRKKPLGLIPSRRQIENSGGYVNNWSTKQFCDYLHQKTNNVLLVRDHGGPLQGNSPDDGMESMLCDVENNFNILHIDPWKSVDNVDDGIRKTLQILEKVCLKDEKIKFEIGTEASIFPYSPDDLYKIIQSVYKFLGSDADRVKYAVVQSGVQISGTSNIGVYNRERLKDMISAVHSFGLLSKEHNGDYLTKQEIRKRVVLGLDSINIAPEFGVMQTREFLKTAFSKGDFVSAYQTCEESKKYSKWVTENVRLDPDKNKKLIIEVSGHYNFTKEPFLSKTEKIKKHFRDAIFNRFDEIVSIWDDMEEK